MLCVIVYNERECRDSSFDKKKLRLHEPLISLTRISFLQRATTLVQQYEKPLSSKRRKKE